MVFEEEASEIRMLGDLGMDATTLGNHEFDYKAKGLANMMNHAIASGDVLPAMVVCNVDWESMEAKGFTEDQQLLWDGFENYGVEDYIVVEKNDVQIAITGVFGEDCLDCVPNCPLEFKNPIEAVKETVAAIQANEEVDMIVCVSHSGTWSDEDKSEDEILAKSVPQLDLIISGHTHTKLNEPIVHGDTYIVSAAEYGKYLGSLTMTQKVDGRWGMEHYELITVDTFIEPDTETQAKVDALYRVVTDFYSSQMLGGVTDMSYGLLSIVPKFADGTPIENYEDAIVMTGALELKAWAAIAEYMTSFEDTDGNGVPDVPAKYGTLEGRKVVEDSKNIGDLLKNPNKFFFMILAVVVAVILILAAVILMVKKVVVVVIGKVK